MKDFMQYHNPDKMGGAVQAFDGKAIVTDKPVQNVEGSRVWLLTGEGRPRRFLLRSYFIVDNVEVGGNGKFKMKLSGALGEVFDPLIPLNQEKWFEEFKQNQGRFRFGLQPISDRRFVEGLETLAGVRAMVPKAKLR